MLPGNESILYRLAMAYLRNDRMEDAREIIARLLNASHSSENTVDDIVAEMKKELEFRTAAQGG